MRYVESHLERSNIPYSYRGRHIYIPTRDRYQPKEICDHLRIPEIQYFENGKRSTLFVPDKHLIRRDASSFFEKEKLGVTLADVMKLQSQKKRQTKATKKINTSDNADDGDWVSLTELKRRKREQNKQEKEEKRIAKIKEDNYLPFVGKFTDKKPKLGLF